jgi:uncharacterized membrane protein YccF (DUF307 family)
VAARRGGDVRTIGNIIWIVFVGIWAAISWWVTGAILIILIVTAPFGRQCFKLANLSLWPFGRTTVADPTAPRLGVVGQVLWIVLAGWWLALGYALSGIVLCVTVIGIPFGIQSFKLAVLSLAPFGKRVVRLDEVGFATAAR